MVTPRILASSIGLSVSIGLGGCNFSAFDDLADEAWVDRVASPDSTSSRQYGESLVATPMRSAGTNLVVLGRSRASISQLQYDAEGKRQSIVAIDPRQTLLFTAFPENPPLAVDSGTDRIAFAVVQGDNADPTRLAVYDGHNIGQTPIKSVVLDEPVDVDGMPHANINVGGIAFAALPGTFGDQGSDDGELVVTRGPQLVVVQDYTHTDTTPTTFAVKGCLHGTDEDWGFGVTVADVDSTHAGPEIIMGSGAQMKNGQSRVLIIAPDQATSPTGTCVALGAPITSAETLGDLGSVVTHAQFPDVADGAPGEELADLIYSAPSANKVFVRFGGGGDAEINAGEAGSDFGDSIATGDLDGDQIPELVIGAPKSDPEGVANGGAVFVYKFRTTPTIGFDLVAALHPGEPTNEERFGKSVAVAPYGTSNRNILVVGAEGEVFTYFRTNLYEDVRAGR